MALEAESMFKNSRQSSAFVGVLALLGSFMAAQGAATLGSGLPERFEEANVAVVFEGLVLSPDGSPAEGAVVVTSAGGEDVVDARGQYRLEARVPRGAERVQVTAVGSEGRNLAASASVGISATTGSLGVDPLMLTQASTCLPSWLPTFGEFPGIGGSAYALSVFDDGGGPALHVGGTFTTAGGVVANNIAKWDGSSWSALGSGVEGSALFVAALAVYDDGGGPALYVGGSFTTAGGVATNNIAKWNGSSWSAVGIGADGFAVTALAVYDDGGGPALYAAGDFTTAAGVAANAIARWDGSSWTALGSGLSGGVNTLSVHDDGSGPALFAGGGFTAAGGVAASKIARWDGSSWSALGSGLSGGVNPGVNALVEYDDGSGPALYAGGGFTTAGGGPANRIAKWDGSSWSALGSEVGGPNPDVFALSVYDDGSGPGLYASGNFTTAGGTAVNGLARWDGSNWSALGSEVNTPWCMGVYDDGSGSALYVGGAFGGTVLGFTGVARWDGAEWSGLGSGMPGSVLALAVHDDGSGHALYAGGNFSTAGSSPANKIAKWNGSSWSALGSGMGGTFPSVQALVVSDDGGGPALYAGGSFTTAGGVAANNIARWNGSSWSALGSGMSGANLRVSALVVYDDGGGPALYAGGSFTTAGGVAANNIAKWNGSSWSALGSGLSGGLIALVEYDDGTGPSLYAAGQFATAGGGAVSNIARWNGSSWSALGSGMNSVVHALSVYDDGTGPSLYAGGQFGTAGGVAASRIARWDGSSWGALGSGMNDRVRALSVFDDGGGPALIAGGEFSSALDSGDSYLAKWGCPDTTAPVLDCPASLTFRDDPTNGAGEVVVFTVTASDDRDPSPSVVCTPPSGSVFPFGSTVVTCTATDASGNESTCQFQVELRPRVRRR